MASGRICVWKSPALLNCRADGKDVDTANAADGINTAVELALKTDARH